MTVGKVGPSQRDLLGTLKKAKSTFTVWYAPGVTFTSHRLATPTRRGVGVTSAFEKLRSAGRFVGLKRPLPKRNLWHKARGSLWAVRNKRAEEEVTEEEDAEGGSESCDSVINWLAGFERAISDSVHDLWSVAHRLTVLEKFVFGAANEDEGVEPHERMKALEDAVWGLEEQDDPDTHPTDKPFVAP